jgi:putative membrane protein
MAITLFLHFVFGATAGLLYGAMEEKVPVSHAVKGPLAGMVVWTGSYLGWIPALGILPSATEQPRRRNLLMIVAHLIWGLTLGALARLFNAGAGLGKTYIELE